MCVCVCFIHIPYSRGFSINISKNSFNLFSLKENVKPIKAHKIKLKFNKLQKFCAIKPWLNVQKQKKKLIQLTFRRKSLLFFLFLFIFLLSLGQVLRGDGSQVHCKSFRSLYYIWKKKNLKLKRVILSLKAVLWRGMVSWKTHT